MTWDAETDVLVVGYGAAGVAAALEARAAGAEVLALDRFNGGGSSTISGGVVYAGGGTSIQRDAGVTDSPEAMLAYLSAEVGDAVRPETLRRFVEQSPAMIEWLRGHGVPFEGSLCPYKTSYPSDRHYLYYSGSEASGGFRDLARPAPRGHRAKRPGTSGKALFQPLAASAQRAGVAFQPHTRVTALVTDETGRVVGVQASTLAGASRGVRARYARCAAIAAKPGIYYPPLRRAMERELTRIERAHARPTRIGARRGVIVSAGGFIADREMLLEHAPRFRGGMVLGTTADDGAGIRLVTGVGGATDRLDVISAWRFIVPPSAFIGSLLVNKAGRRVVDESRYGAVVGQAMVTESAGVGWLLVDADLLRDARGQLADQTVWFQRVQTEALLRTGAVRADTIEALAAKAGIDAAGLRATVDAHNTAITAGAPDPLGKPDEFRRPLATAPFTLLDVTIRPSVSNPCPMLTLGGVVVDEDTGAVRDTAGGEIAGLYAAGRTAVGVCSRSYVSGLSLADCIFSGRRAGVHAAVADAEDDQHAHR